MTETTFQRPTWAEIDLDNLAFNFLSVKEFAGTGLKYMAVVKADGYGHGAIECAKRLEAEGVDWFGVALPEEGVELRKAGIRKRILCLGGFWNGHETTALNYNLTPAIFQIEKAKILNDAAKSRGTTVNVHVKVDTGMGRVGVRHDEIREFAEALRPLEHLILEGVMTHFAAADDMSENDFTNLQVNRFDDAVSVLRDLGFNPVYLDLANSPATVALPESRGNMVRLGGVLYGLGGDVLPKSIEKPDLKPVMSLHTRIAHLKNVPAGETIGYGRTYTTVTGSVIATLPIGYEDGFRRSLSNSGRAIVGNTIAPVVGRISMDWTMIDVTGIQGVGLGDEVILIGRQNDLEIRAEDLAAEMGTIAYEVTCSIDRRVPRKYKSDSE